MASQQRATIDRKPILDQARRRIQDALKETLNEVLANGQGLDLDGASSTILGPWSMLVGEGDAWGTRACLSPELYVQIRGHFSDNITREVLLAAAGVKVSRTLLSDAKLEFLRAMAGQHGFRVLASHERYIRRPDEGKGGFSNRVRRLVGPEEASGLRRVYVASDPSLAEAGKLLEEAGDDQLFGMLLAIPPCCREAYARFAPVAKTKQWDLIPLVLDNTPGGMPYDPWLNYVANYFGRALLSFFPCSFQCPAARVVARNTYAMLAHCDLAWGRSFLDLQHTNILYTEYQGLHLFRRPLLSGSIEYGPQDFDSTEPTHVTAIIGRGDRLEVRGQHQVDIYRGVERIGVLEGEDISLCVFW